MKAAQPDSKRKIFNALGFSTNPMAMFATAGAIMVVCALPEIYHSHFSETDVQTQTREQQTALIEKRVAGIAPMRKYVAELKEQAEVVLKLPVDALPAGTDPVKLRAQGVKLAAAYEAEVRATTLDIWLTPALRLGDAHDLKETLDKATGSRVYEIFGLDQPNGFFRSNFQTCKLEVAAQSGYTHSEADVKKVFDCTNAYAAPYNKIALDVTGLLAIGFAGAAFTRRRLGKKIAAEDALVQNIPVTAVAVAPVAPAPVINTTTGQDIIVKPIKITAKAAP